MELINIKRAKIKRIIKQQKKNVHHLISFDLDAIPDITDITDWKKAFNLLNLQGVFLTSSKPKIDKGYRFSKRI